MVTLGAAEKVADSIGGTRAGYAAIGGAGADTDNGCGFARRLADDVFERLAFDRQEQPVLAQRDGPVHDENIATFFDSLESGLFGPATGGSHRRFMVA